MTVPVTSPRPVRPPPPAAKPRFVSVVIPAADDPAAPPKAESMVA